MTIKGFQNLLLSKCKDVMALLQLFVILIRPLASYQSSKVTWSLMNHSNRSHHPKIHGLNRPKSISSRKLASGIVPFLEQVFGEYPKMICNSRPSRYRQNHCSLTRITRKILKFANWIRTPLWTENTMTILLFDAKYVRHRGSS
jgi:hypothetical protein